MKKNIHFLLVATLMSNSALANPLNTSWTSQGIEVRTNGPELLTAEVIQCMTSQMLSARGVAKASVVPQLFESAGVSRVIQITIQEAHRPWAERSIRVSGNGISIHLPSAGECQSFDSESILRSLKSYLRKLRMEDGKKQKAELEKRREQARLEAALEHFIRTFQDSSAHETSPHPLEN